MGQILKGSKAVVSFFMGNLIHGPFLTINLDLTPAGWVLLGTPHQFTGDRLSPH